MRILLIEDDKLIGDGIKAGLTKLGFNLTGSPTASSAKCAGQCAVRRGDPRSQPAGPRRSGSAAPVAPGRARRAGPDPHRPRRAGAASQRAAKRRRRLSVQAVRAGRSGGAPAGADPPSPRPTDAAADARQRGVRQRHPQRELQRRAGDADAARIGGAGTVSAQQGAGAGAAVDSGKAVQLG